MSEANSILMDVRDRVAWVTLNRRDAGNAIDPPMARSLLQAAIVCDHDGRGLVAALALGAEGINMGTQFCATQEAPIHETIKQFIVANDERATNLIFRRFHNTGRVAKNSVSDRVVEISRLPEAVFEDIRPLVGGALGRKALETGDLDAGLVWAGQVQGLIHDVPTCRELIDRIGSEAQEIIADRLATIGSAREARAA